MDKNNIIGFGLIAAILIGFFYMTKPSEEQIAAQQRYQDSIRYEQQLRQAEEIVSTPAALGRRNVFRPGNRGSKTQVFK